MAECKNNIELFIQEIVCEKCGTNVNKLDYDRHLKTHKEKRGKHSQFLLNFSIVPYDHP